MRKNGKLSKNRNYDCELTQVEHYQDRQQVCENGKLSKNRNYDCELTQVKHHQDRLKACENGKLSKNRNYDRDLSTGRLRMTAQFYFFLLGLTGSEIRSLLDPAVSVLSLVTSGDWS